MSVQKFENKRWHQFSQKSEFRHRACLELITDGTVLDIGCGDGFLLTQLKAANIVATGIDISSEAVKQCREAGLTATEHSLDEPLPFPDNSFDTVILLDVLEHLYDPVSVFTEARRVARARIIVGVPNFSSFPARVQTLLGSVPENNHPGKGHVYWFNYSILMNMAKHVTLVPDRLKMNSFFPVSYFGDSIVRIWPHLLALSFVLELRK